MFLETFTSLTVHSKGVEMVKYVEISSADESISVYGAMMPLKNSSNQTANRDYRTRLFEFVVPPLDSLSGVTEPLFP
jgi:hypothetical protein